jgi:hypothetical protein
VKEKLPNINLLRKLFQKWEMEFFSQKFNDTKMQHCMHRIASLFKKLIWNWITNIVKYSSRASSKLIGHKAAKFSWRLNLIAVNDFYRRVHNMFFFCILMQSIWIWWIKAVLKSVPRAYASTIRRVSNIQIFIYVQMFLTI